MATVGRRDRQDRHDPSFTERTNFLRRWWSDPQTYPDEFKAWQRSALVQDPNIIWELSQIPTIPYKKLDVPAGSIPGSKSIYNVGTTPPANPVNGDLWIYQGAGFYWLFVYDSNEATYKWKFIGGPPLLIRGTGNGTFNSASYTDLSGATAPAFTAPRSGEYVLDYSAHMTTTGTLADILRCAPSIAGAAPSDADATIAAFPASGGATIGSSPHMATLATLAAAQVAKLQFKRVNNSCSSGAQELKVTPVRVS